jgi:hypothetical protein
LRYTTKPKPNRDYFKLRINGSYRHLAYIDPEQFTFAELVDIHEKLVRGLIRDYQLTCADPNGAKLKERLEEILDHLLNGPIAKENQALAKKILARQGVVLPEEIKGTA